MDTLKERLAKAGKRAWDRSLQPLAPTEGPTANDFLEALGISKSFVHWKDFLQYRTDLLAEVGDKHLHSGNRGITITREWGKTYFSPAGE